MEKIFLYKKTIIEKESLNEFYLNPKDIIFDEKINEINYNLNTFYYLYYNELLVILFENNISFIDIKKSICKNITIIKYININEIFLNNFNIKEEKKIKIIKSNNFSNFCFNIRENELKLIKNFNVLEFKNCLNKIFIIIEFKNLDFIISKYNNIQIENKYTVLYKHSKNYFLNLFNSFLLNYESNLIYNYNSIIKIKNNYIFHFVESILFIFELNENNYKFLHKIKLNIEIKKFLVFKNKNKNEYCFILLNNNNNIEYFYFDINNLNVLNKKQINIENLSNINILKIIKLNQDKKYFLFSELNNIYIYTINFENKLIEYYLKINFIYFEDCLIKDFFICMKNILYAFNSNGEYSYEYLNIENNNNNNIINNKIKNLNLVKYIYDIILFKNKFGFFILGTQNNIKFGNINISIFLPIEIIDNNPINEVFLDNNLYSNFFNELLIYNLRFKNDIINNNNNNIYYKRLNFYLNKIKNTEINENENIIKYILLKYKEINNLNYNYNIYLNNEKYVCDFCNEKFINYKNNLFLYNCEKLHETFSCCITFEPFQENFLQCKNCNLFYNNSFSICIICQQMLNLSI
jgi:hypothetical protein